MFPGHDVAHGKTCFHRQFRLRKIGLDALQEQVVAQGFNLGGYEFSGMKSLLEMIKSNHYGSLCNTQQLTQPALARSVPLRGRRHESPVAQFLVVRRLESFMSDDDFIQQFESCTFPFTEWHHRAHVKLAYLYAVRFGSETAAQKLRDGIRAYNAANKVQDAPTSGYHETMTQAWLHIIHTTIQEYGPKATADEFFEFHPQLGQKKILRLFYSVDLSMSPLAKREFVQPDLTSLPQKHHAPVA